MIAVDSFPLAALGLALVAGLFALGVALARVARARARARRRLVEKPNSHYTAPLVRENETRHRWHDIDLDRVHEINRAEVVRLLDKVDAAGLDAIRTTEREFLDQIAKISRRPAEPKHREPNQPLPHLREHPAV